MLTADERLVLITTIALHGFDLYERFEKRTGYWRPFLVGRPLGDGHYEGVFEWIKDRQVSPYRSKVQLGNAQPKNWIDLPDDKLQAFYNTVVSTC